MADCIYEAQFDYEDGKKEPDIQKPDKFSRINWLAWDDMFYTYFTNRLVTAQDVPFALILWYVEKIIYFSYEQDQFLIKSSDLIFDCIDLVVCAFYVR